MSWLRRLSNTFRSGRHSRELDQELSFHIAERVDDLQASGMSREDASRLARQQFGNPLVQREHTRDVDIAHTVDVLLSSVRYAARSLIRTPTFTATAVLALGLGIGATAAVFTVVNAVLIRPLPYPDPDGLVSVWHSAQFQQVTSNNIRLSSTMYFAYRRYSQTFQHFGAWSTGNASVTGLGDPEQIRTVAVTDGVLQALAVPPALGQSFSATDHEPGTPDRVILSHPYWQRRFGGDPSIIGRAITIDSRSRTVSGVMPPAFRFPNAEADAILPLRFEGPLLLPNDVHAYVGIARLKPDASIEQARADVARMLPLWIAEYGTNVAMLERARFTPALRPLKQDVIGDIGSMLWLLMGTIAIVLLIACANVANLLLVRAGQRDQELSLRAALGAGWRQLARQLLAESVLLGLAGGALGLAFAYAGLRLLVAMAPANLPRLAEISIDPLVLTFTLAVSIGCGLLFGSMPVLQSVVWRRTSDSLKRSIDAGGRAASREHYRSQDALMALQVALAVVLLAASGLMIRSFEALRAINPGFTAPHTVQTVRLSIPQAEAIELERVARMQHDIVEQIARISGVRSVAFATALPMEMEFENSMTMTGEGLPPPAGIPPLRRAKSISPDFFDTLGIPWITGRDFTWSDILEARPVVIVSERLAREMWGDSATALGKRIRVGAVGEWNEIVGIASDVHDSGVDQAAPAIVYWRAGVSGGGKLPLFVPREVSFAIRSDQAGSEDLIRQVGEAIWAVNRNLPLARVQTLGDVYNQSMARTSFTLVMLAIAGFMALALGIVGVYGVIAYTVSVRRREIGIRLALGARRTGILRQFLGHGIRVATVACLGGAVLSLFFTRALSGMLFGVSPFDPTTLASVVGIVLVVATLAALIPAARAACLEPIRTLREQ